MAEIINLRQARKAARRKQDEATAAANRAKFGRTRAERVAQASEQIRAARLLDGAKREHD
ncbi:DUF4169 family protein [Blastomonas sp. UPD001]|uniref:DUF4169 family protein n=1 Tax=Blastomonas sp. UPD001 TaxID=2217673 RepID=UPI000E34AEC5|nr:DUF4169 family protein [Blastomonas sp. UPD001]